MSMAQCRIKKYRRQTYAEVTRGINNWELLRSRESMPSATETLWRILSRVISSTAPSPLSKSQRSSPTCKKWRKNSSGILSLGTNGLRRNGTALVKRGAMGSQIRCSKRSYARKTFVFRRECRDREENSYSERLKSVSVEEKRGPKWLKKYWFIVVFVTPYVHIYRAI